jgi:hypothetical protein
VKTIQIETETRPLAEWLPNEDSDDLVYLTRDGRPRFVLVPLDEGDEEVLAVQKNARLMAYISACVERARNGPTKTLAQIKAELGLADDAHAAAPVSADAEAPRKDGAGPR